jgi:hypothetical protein
MTNLVTAAEQAAIPTAIAALQAVKAFAANMGPDPAQWVVKYPGSKLILLGTIANLVPSLLVSEGGALDTAVNGQVDGWIAALQKAQTSGA